MAKITYELHNFNSSDAREGKLCAMVVFSPSTVSDNKISNIINTSSTSTPNWVSNPELKGVGICKFTSPNKYIFTVDSINYIFDEKGAANSLNARGWKLWMATVDARNITKAGSTTPTNTASSATRASGGSITEEEDYDANDSLVKIDNLQARDEFAVQALRAMLASVPDPSVLSENEINYYCETAYKWASYMMRSAADARGSFSEGESTTVPDTDLNNNIEKLLKNIATAITNSGGGGGTGDTVKIFNGQTGTPAADKPFIVTGPAGGLGVNIGVGTSSQNPLYISGGSNITVDSGLSTSSPNPVMNSVITQALNGKQETLVAGSGITINGNEISAVGGGGTIDIDNAMSSTSGNPVANRVITQALTTKQNTLTAGTGIAIVGDVISATGGGGSSFNGEIQNASGTTLATQDSALRATSGVSNTLYTELVQLHKDMGYDWQGTGTSGISTQELRLRDIRSQIYNIAVSQKYIANDQTYGDTNTIAYFLKQIADNTAGGGSGGGLKHSTTNSVDAPTYPNTCIEDLVIFSSSYMEDQPGMDADAPYRVSIGKFGRAVAPHIADSIKPTLQSFSFDSSGICALTPADNTCYYQEDTSGMTPASTTLTITTPEQSSTPKYMWFSVLFKPITSSFTLTFLHNSPEETMLFKYVNKPTSFAINTYYKVEAKALGSIWVFEFETLTSN